MRKQNLFFIMRINLISILLGLFTTQSFAQKITITGIVKDQSGEPLIGVNVMEKGTTNGSITDMDGKYSVSSTSKKTILVFSYIGYISQEIPVANRKTIDVTMKEDTEELEEVVVIGYGTAKKKDLTGAISRVKTEKLETEAPRSVQDLLRASASGLSISMSTDAAGTADLQIRGKNSLKAGSSPLLVLDGVIYDGSLQDINPMDIENIDIHDAKCSAISLGKEISTGDNESTRTHRKSGYQYQKEAVYKALHAGWEKGVVGGHVVRGNVIYDCGQNGVVGHMGCAFSLIEGNHIYRIGSKREFFGWEVAAIKMHAAVDTVVRGNRVHDSVLGMWLDWQAQGTVVDSNVFYRNTRDVMTEVTHGPITFMNNVFASEFSFDDYAQGAAFVNNLFAGRIRHTAVLDRSTPYHFPHVTDVAGEAFVYGGDDRYVNNLFLAVDDSAKPLCTADAAGAAGMAEAGTAFFDGYPRSLEEYEQLIEEAGLGDEELYRSVKQPVLLASNAYVSGAKAASGEAEAVVSGDGSSLALRETDDELWMTVSLPESIRSATGPVISTADLGQPRIVEEYFENPDGSPIVVDRDITGAARGACSARGPLAAYGDGEVLIWSK